MVSPPPSNASPCGRRPSAPESLLTAAFAAGVCLLSALPALADFVVLRNGSRLNVTGYEILGDKYRLHVQGGTADVPVDDIVAIEPEEVL